MVPAWPVSTSQPHIVKTAGQSQNRKQNLKLISATLFAPSKTPICQNCPGDGKMRADVTIMKGAPGSGDDDQDRGGGCKPIALCVTSSYRKSLLFETINS